MKLARRSRKLARQLAVQVSSSAGAVPRSSSCERRMSSDFRLLSTARCRSTHFGSGSRGIDQHAAPPWPRIPVLRVFQNLLVCAAGWVRCSPHRRCGEMADATDLKSVGLKRPCRFESGHRYSSAHRTLIRVNRITAIWAKPYTLRVIDGIMARTAVRAHRKHSSAPAGYLAFFRGSVLRDFATLIFLSHTFLYDRCWLDCNQ